MNAHQSTYPVAPVARVVAVRLAVEVVHGVPAQKARAMAPSLVCVRSG